MIRRVLVAACIAFVAASAAAETLRGGSTATLSMSPPERLPDHVEEWEAFLSLDGGAHYAIRITPHLDLNVRAVQWVVPNVDARAARIMIRAGDERNETSFELPDRFAIARDANAPLPAMRIAPTSHAEEGVVAWAEGDRAGTRVVLATNVPPPSGIDSVRAGEAFDNALFDGPRISRTAIAQLATSKTTPQPRNCAAPQNHNPDILLLSRRLNV
jgi:hypothetical protein